MASDFRQLYSTYREFLDVFLEDENFFNKFIRILKDSQNDISFVKKQCVKSLELDWIETIERYLPSVDKCIRNPRKFIENREEILPIGISRNITAESIKHLAQHTNYIDNIEGDVITPSKILNVFKEESMITYENRFVYTLLNRLYIFITKRYDKIKDAMLADDYLSIKLNQKIEVSNSEKVDVAFELTSASNTSTDNEISRKDFNRVDKLRRIIMDYNASPFAKAMKDSQFIKPPVTRTNAIMKNVELRDCLNLWLFIESYDKIGYSIDMIDTVTKPEKAYIEELNSMIAINYAMFKFYTTAQDEDLIIRKVRRKKAIVPKFVKDIYSEFTEDYNISEVEFRKIMDVQLIHLRRKKSGEERKIKTVVDHALAAEARYKREQLKLQKKKEAEKIAKEQARLNPKPKIRKKKK